MPFLKALELLIFMREEVQKEEWFKYYLVKLPEMDTDTYKPFEKWYSDILSEYKRKQQMQCESDAEIIEKAKRIQSKVGGSYANI